MLSVLGRDDTEMLMGHEGYLDSSYLRRTSADFERIAAKYVEGMGAVTILTPAPETLLQNVESLATLKALEMNVTDHVALLEEASKEKSSALTIGEKIEILQSQRMKEVEEERTRRFSEEVELELRRAWYVQGKDGMNDHEIRGMAAKFGVKDYQNVLRDRGIEYHHGEGCWKYLLLETKKSESRYVSKEERERETKSGNWSSRGSR